MDEENKVTEDLVFIETSDFQEGKEMLIEIRAKIFNDSDIIYEFLDDPDDDNKLGINTYIQSPYNTKIDNAYTSNYYRIKKELGNGVEGTYLALIFNCTGEVIFGSTYMPSTKEKDILKKDSEISLKASEGGFIFDSSSYNDGDKIYFKIKATKFNEKSLYYEFCDDLTKYYPKYLYKDYNEAPSSKTQTNKSYEINYFTVEKDSKTLEKGKIGKYLIAYFDCEGTVTIKNTLTDEGNKKTSNTVIIVIVVIIIVIGVAVTAYSCYKKRKKDGGNIGEVEVYNEPPSYNQNANNIINNNNQKVNVQNNKKNKKKNNQNQMNQKNIQQNNYQNQMQNTPKNNNMNINLNNQNTPNYNNMNINPNSQNTQNYNTLNINQNNQYNQNYNYMNINPNNQNTPMINQNNQMNPNYANNNNQGYTSVQANENNENYTSSKINAQNYDVNIDSKNQFNQNYNMDQMNNNAAPNMGFPNY